MESPGKPFETISKKKKEPDPGKIIGGKKRVPEKSSQKTYAEVLTDYLPIESLEEICNTLACHKVFVKITRRRYTKLGDYRPPVNGTGHRITINHDLNHFSFLLTMVHELAHLTTWEKFRRKAKPHGLEWKNEFRHLLQAHIEKKVFPAEIVKALNNYLINPAASSCTDIQLMKTLRNFDKKEMVGNTFHLEEIPGNSIFSLAGSSKIFRKGKKLRKRFLCAEIKTKRKYLISPVAQVIPIKID